MKRNWTECFYDVVILATLAGLSGLLWYYAIEVTIRAVEVLLCWNKE